MSNLSRFSVGPLSFVRRPLSDPPADGTPCIVDNGDERSYTQTAGAYYRDGEWKPAHGREFRFTPTHWIDLEPGR